MRMRVFGAWLANVLMLMLMLGGCTERVARSALAPGAVVLAFGDSVTHGTGAPPGADYPSRLQAISGWTVINAGIPGDTAQAATARIDAALSAHAPQLVIIELGGNDFLRGRSQGDVKDDLRALVRSVKQANAIPVLVAVPALSLWRATTNRLDDAPIYADLAEEEDIAVIDAVFASVLSNPALRADPIHPNAAGYQMLADGIAKALRKTGFLANP